jgi:hypothetical protein
MTLIMITEEWLMEKGFENITDKSHANHPRIRTMKKEMLTIYLPEFKCRLFGLTNDNAWLDMKYRHKLQGLYKSLTGHFL